MTVEGAVLGFMGGVLVSLVAWMVFVFAPIALLGDVNAEMPGWAIAASVWWSALCGVIGAVLGAVRL